MFYRYKRKKRLQNTFSYDRKYLAQGAKKQLRRMFMLGRHQRVTAKERTLVTTEFKQTHSFHTHEKRRLKRAMNKRMRQALKQEAVSA